MSKKYKIKQSLIDKHTKILKAVELEIEKTNNKAKKYDLLQTWKSKREHIRNLIITQKNC